jgi:uncharacterized protein
LTVRHPWLVYVLPLVVYLLMGALGADRPAPATAVEKPSAEDRARSVAPPSGEAAKEAELRRSSYPWAYTLQLAATICAMLLVAPGYTAVPWGMTRLAVIVGVAGGVLWVVVCRAGLEVRWLTALGLADWAGYAARPAFDPLTAFRGAPWDLAVFLVIRFAGLMVIVPVIEEFFVRGFLMRFIAQANWWKIPLGQVTWKMAAVATLYGVLAHPAEWVAAALWFSLITLLYARTRSLWDCVVAHALTNGVLGIYVLAWQDWTLW